MSISDNVKKIKATIKQSESKNAQILAVTKYADKNEIFEAYRAGIRIFGENYVIPGLAKINELKSSFTQKVEWHLIGTLQKNKVNKAVGNYDMIQSVDSLELAQMIGAEAKEQGIDQAILLQVNTTGELSKGGFKPKELQAVFSQIEEIENIDIKGLMTIGPTSPAEFDRPVETVFDTLRQLKRELISGPCILSMGMSSDYEIALEYGSNMVRLGRAIFSQEQ